MESDLALAFLDYFSMVFISTIIAAICSAVTIANCVREHKLLTSAKMLMIYWFVWILWLLFSIFSSKIGQGFGILSTFTMYLHDHLILNIAFTFIVFIALYFIKILPFIMLIYLIIKESFLSK